MTGAKALDVRWQIHDTHVHRTQASYVSLIAIRNEVPLTSYLLPSVYSIKLRTLGGSSVANQSTAAIHSRVTCMNKDEEKSPPSPPRPWKPPTPEISNPPPLLRSLSRSPESRDRLSTRPLYCPSLRSSSLLSLHIISDCTRAAIVH